MGSRGAFVDVNNSDFSFVVNGQHYKSLGILHDNPNVKIIVQDTSNVKAPEFSRTAGRIYAIVKNGELKHLAYYDENHKQLVLILLIHIRECNRTAMYILAIIKPIREFPLLLQKRLWLTK